MICEWTSLTKGSRCVRCGYALKRDYAKAPILECTVSCVHFGEQIRFELIQCETCQGNVRIKHPVHACAIFGECLPCGALVERLKRCEGCESYKPAT